MLVTTHQHPHQAPGLQLGDVLQLARPGEPLLAVLTPGDHSEHANIIYRVSGLSCPEAQAYLTVIFHSFLHNNNINSDYILGANIYFTPHSIFSSYF